MAQVPLATKIHRDVRSALVDVCAVRGLKIGRFIEEAILDKLEEMEDIGDVNRLRRETFRPFKDLVRELKASGRL